MVNRLNLRLFIKQWFNTREEDDKLRPCWIRKHCGEINEQCTQYNGQYNLYKNGKWNVE